ncbi:hypothetical protein SAMN04487925_11122 [Bradyrhizobium sp. cf659]|nr:hypothetical protein SAMN04487925_11122 [Bradyrhizobium sp. cf659]
MRFANKRESARLALFRSALRDEFGNYHAINRTVLHREMTKLRTFRRIPL